MPFESSYVPATDGSFAGETATLVAPATLSAPTVLRVGLVGCGGFARFAVGQYRRLPGVSIECVADVQPAAAERAAAELDAAVLPPAEVLAHPALDLVYIATPPACHFEQAAAALAAGKHVLVEKPLATGLDDARSLERLAAERELVCVANLLERYCPLAETIRRLLASGLLGDLVHGLFLNEAADEGLGHGHWFWDRSVSGGIFVEHGVHFFDLVASWLGAGRVVTASRSVRPARGSGLANGNGGGGTEEQAICTCRYAGDHALVLPDAPHRRHEGILFHFEHGFHQATPLDRQEMRLVFERGEVRLFDWVPTRGTLRALGDEESAETLARMLLGSVVRITSRHDEEERRVRGRFHDFESTMTVEISFPTGLEKLALYAKTVHDLAEDQFARVRNPLHVRRLTEADSVASVAMACEADRLALDAG